MSTPIYERPAELLQNLIRFDTTNPPGNEAECIGYIDGLLRELDIETTLLEKVPNRPNLVARIIGDGDAPPLLLQGHVDVVTTKGQNWTQPPFCGDIIDDYVWGRGALDMKGGVAMMLAAFMRAKSEGVSLPGDVIFCALADEEAGGKVGAGFLVEEHAELFKDVRYSIGEFGGFTLPIGGKRFYPIMAAEKQICWLNATVRGPAGHGSMPISGGAMAKIGAALTALDRHPLPVHITPVFRQMIEIISAELSFPTNTLLRQLLNPRLTGRVLKLMGDQGKIFSPLVRNTVSPTIIQGGNKVNVIPSAITLQMDGRLLPGYSPGDMKCELQAVLGDAVELEIVRYEAGPPEPDMSWFDTLAGILKEADPEGIPVPLLLSGVTDARFFAQLGIQTYGFLPMQLPEDFKFTQTIHAADERIPVKAVAFGADCVYKALQRR
jgi:acetylornithine deacetylase/succinyl-diaminopimelate desuccinylase-like protein